MNNNATIGLIVGLLLAIAATTGGFGGFILAIVLGAVGLAVGLHRDGTIDLSGLLRSRNRG
ncbi:hypothetical protein ASG12_02425 [Williamsia sp. Leaf354]|uniref:DUF2273 domain-containing protein n=1 Tax=Williamsia herbipolensis TaxID=1603258 RepID=A0AAU4JY10_9NOCA|nr:MULTISPECIES: DUF2273 domain-containing protein [Williamsia]KQR99670.1 hypothetical protein ASG12_02425 [Williamsia sp. Leaf354]MCX6468925.1 DUF2273 domain-containing protein [Mycobacteriales bacterium]